MFFQEHYESSFTDGILDGGATAGLVGAATLEKYLYLIRQYGLDPRWTKQYPTSKRFRFGDDKVMVSKTAALVPVTVNGHFGLLMLYVIPGGTPFLVARPMMESLGISIDYGQLVKQ